VVRVAQSVVFGVVFCVLYPGFDSETAQYTTQKTTDWATRTTLNTNDIEHKILHRKLMIGQHKPH
jgi:hypothetical protein